MQSSFSNAASPHMKARLEILRKKFIAGIPKRLDEIDAAPSQSARMQALHKLAGAALGYNAQELGELARSTEAELETNSNIDWPERMAAFHAEFVKLQTHQE